MEQHGRHGRSAGNTRRTCALAPLIVAFLLLCVPAISQADTTIDFEQFAPGTTLTNQYADLGGPGQGVVFGPLPGGGDGLRPVIKSVGVGTANSGTQVADISNCSGCEQYLPNTVGTFQVPRSHISVDAGYAGGNKPVCSQAQNTTAQCAGVTLTAYDSSGNPVGTPSTAIVGRGRGYHTLLSVQVGSPTIVGFRVSARSGGTDNNKPIGIDDLSYDVPATPPPADFTVTPSDTTPVTSQGHTLTDAISVGRLSGSSGGVQLSLSGNLPAGVTASFDPDPATGNQSVLTFTVAPGAVPTGFNPVPLTITGTPTDPSAGATTHSATVNLQVRSAFDLSLHGTKTDYDLAACSVDVPFEVDRDSSFAGPVSLSVSGQTNANGLRASFNPAQATFPNGERGETIPMTVTAPATGVSLPPTTLTVHASAPPLADRTATVTVHGACPEQYDARITSVQITQGVQSTFLPGFNTTRHPPNQYNYTQIPSEFGQTPSVAELRGGGPTVVRVYADEASGPTTGVPAVPAALYVSSYDRFGQPHLLAGSPILPIGGPRTLVPGLDTASVAEERDENGAYTFVLPPAWTHGEIAINAVLLPSTGAASQTFSPCTTSDCVANDSYGLTHIPFLEAPPVTIDPVVMTVAGRPPLPDAQTVFSLARVVTPLNLSIEPYAGTIDITDIAHTFDACNIAADHDNAKLNKCSDQANDDGAERMDDWTCDNGSPENGFNIGVNTGVARGLTKTDYCIYQVRAPQNSVVEANRPLTSVTHEFFHLLGLPHASSGCGGGDNGQVAESWPPDQVGYINGVGLDTAMGSGVNSGPFAIIGGAPPKPGCKSKEGQCGGAMPAQSFDFMSYCASDGPHPPTGGNAWVSLRNWNAVLESHRFHKPIVEARATGPPSLRVGAFLSPDGTVGITSVAPLAAAAQPASSSPYHLVGSDASGKVLADVPMIEAPMHVDGEQPPIPLIGAIPSAGVATVAIVRDGVTLASRARSAHPPKVAVTGVPTVHKGASTIRWRATDADGGPLMVDVDFSSDGGSHFHRIFVGKSTGIAHVPARYLSRAAKARVRVTVNDGFQTASATSRRFRSPGAPPDVTIVNPAGGFREPDDTSVVLSGQAFDDRGKGLTGKRLRWVTGHRVLGTGQSIAAAGLKPGRRRITLIARDRFGRTARHSIVGTITAARPIFLTLKAPGSVKRKARSFGLKVSSSLPARLTVSASGVHTQRFQVGRHARKLQLHIPRGTKALKLRLRLKSGSKATSRTIRIRRR